MEKVNDQKIVGNQTLSFRLVLLLIFLGAGVLIYSPSLKGELVLDDLHTLLQNPFIKIFEPARFFKDAYAFSAKLGNNPYRPLVVLSYALDWKLGKGNWKVFHFTNIFLHALVAFFLMVLAQMIFKNSRAGILAGLLFLVHPLPGFSACYLSARSGILATLFLLISLYLWLLFREEPEPDKRKFFFSLHLVFFLFALLSKIDSLILIPIIGFLILVRERERNAKTIFQNLLPISILGLAFLILYKIQVGTLFGPTQSSMSPFYSRSQSLTAGILSPAIYFFKLLLPAPLTIFPALPEPKNLMIALAILCYLLAIAGALFARSWSWDLVLTWYFSALAPLLLLRLNILLAWHRGYLALAGLFLGIGLGFDLLLTKKKKLGLSLLLVVLLILGGMAYSQSQIWQKSSELWANAVKSAPKESVPHHYLAISLLQEGKKEQAEKEVSLSLQLNPSFADAHNTLAVLLFQKGEYEKARGEFERAYLLDPENYVYLENLIMARFQLREIEGMDSLFHRLKTIAPLTDLQAQRLYQFYLEIKDQQSPSLP